MYDSSLYLDRPAPALLRGRRLVVAIRCYSRISRVAGLSPENKLPYTVTEWCDAFDIKIDQPFLSAPASVTTVLSPPFPCLAA